MWLTCSISTCRTRVAPTAFTPMCRNSLKPEHYLDLAYLFSIGTRADQAAHIAGLDQKVVESCYRALRTVTAFQEYTDGTGFVAPPGAGDADGAKFGVIGKNTPASTHAGRMLAVTARASSERVLVPLQPREAPTGRNQGPESYEEVKARLERCFPDGTVMLTDSAQAFQKVARTMKRPAAPHREPHDWTFLASWEDSPHRARRAR